MHLYNISHSQLKSALWWLWIPNMSPAQMRATVSFLLKCWFFVAIFYHISFHPIQGTTYQKKKHYYSWLTFKITLILRGSQMQMDMYSLWCVRIATKLQTFYAFPYFPIFTFMYLPSLITNFKSKLLTNQQECEILFNA